MLSDENRAKLDSIVQQMAQKNAPIGDVQAIVADFKQKFDTPDVQAQQQAQGGSFWDRIKTNFSNDPVFGAIGNFFTGAAKGAGSTVVGAMDLAKKIPGGEGVVNAITSPEIQAQMKAQTKTEGTAQAVGAGAEQIAEYFAPGAAEKFAIKGFEGVIDAAKLAERFGPKACPILDSIAKILGTGVVTGASTAGVTAIQTGGDTSQITGSGIAGFLGGATAKALEFAAPGISKYLERANLKMTPTQKMNLAPKIEGIVAETSKLKSMTPTGRYSEITGVWKKMENTLQTFLQKGPAKDVVAPTKELMSSLENLKIKYQASDVSDLQAAAKQIDDAISRLKVYGDNIPLSRLNNLKRSVFDSAYNAAGNKVLDFVEHDIGNTYREAIERYTKGMTLNGVDICTFNKQY